MNESNWYRRFRQYGYDTDVFDKYRDAVARYNGSALKVLGPAGCLMGVASLALMLISGKTGGLFFAVLTLIAGIAGTAATRMQNVDRRIIQTAGYVLCATFYGLAIYGNQALRTDAFWVGVNMAMSCYLLYYATQLLTIQVISFGALVIACDQAGGFAGSPYKFAVYTAFLLAGIVTLYVTGRARIGLIMSREVTKKQADTDLLTGLMIRNAAQLDIEGHLAENSESGVLMLLDLDRFKSVNDKLGHQMGDKVIQTAGSTIMEVMEIDEVERWSFPERVLKEEGSFAGRLGGDEFIILVRKCSSQEEVQHLLERVLAKLNAVRFEGLDGIHASIGITELIAGEDIDAAYSRADEALYASKREGKNRIMFSEGN